jgi:hypothetical protein
VACGFLVRPTSASPPPSGGDVTITVEAQPGCAWSVESSADWIKAGSPGGSGNGSVTLAVAANPGPSRSAVVRIGGQEVTVSQASVQPTCTSTISPSSQSFDAAGGTGSVTLTTAAGCQWTASPSATWITITAGTSGAGTGPVQFSVAANPTISVRQSAIVVGGHTFAISQAGTTCKYAIDPGGQTVAVGGGNVTVNVTSGTGCAWIAQSNVPWVSVASGASGTGNGAVTLNVQANTGASRSGTVTIAGQTFTISQAATSCNYSIEPNAHTTGAGGGTTTVDVATGPSCSWTAVSNDPWITVTSGASGTGPGPVTLTIAVNPESGSSRSGSVTIAGQTFTVQQASAPCSYALSPPSQPTPPGGGTGSIALTTGASCDWTVTLSPGSAWLTVTNGSSGIGGRTITFSTTINTGPPRRAEISVGGQTVSVTQETCTYSIFPTRQDLPSAATKGTVTVTASHGSCGWTASEAAPWIELTAASGAGSGTVGYSVQANTGGARSAVVTIAGQSFTINQAAR